MVSPRRERGDQEVRGRDKQEDTMVSPRRERGEFRGRDEQDDTVTLPVLRKVVGKLSIKDLIRMSAVSPSWHSAIINRSTPFIYGKQPSRSQDLPWFYFHAKEDKKSAVATVYDPNMEKWEWLEQPILESNGMVMTKSRSSSNSLCRHSYYVPACSVGSLVAWVPVSPTKTSKLYVHKAFTNFVDEVDMPSHRTASCPGFTYAEPFCEFLHMERGPQSGYALYAIRWDHRKEQISIKLYDKLSKTFKLVTHIKDIDSLCVGAYYYNPTKALLAFFSSSRGQNTLKIAFFKDSQHINSMPLPRSSEDEDIPFFQYEIIQMDERLLLIALAKNNKGEVMVHLYEYIFQDETWSPCINKDLKLPPIGEAYNYLECVARAGLLMLMRSWFHLRNCLPVSFAKSYLYNMHLDTWKDVPSCNHPTFQESNIRIGCALDPSLRDSLN